MIEKTIENWHAFLRSDLELDDLLHEECVFLSPVVFKPLKGREMTKLYLNINRFWIFQVHKIYSRRKSCSSRIRNNY